MRPLGADSWQGGFVMCPLTRLRFPELPSPYDSGWNGPQETFCVITGGQKWSSSTLFLHLEDWCRGTRHCCRSHMLSLICWLTSLVWGSSQACSQACSCSTFPGIFSNSWARCIFNSVMKGTSFFYRTPTSSKLKVVRDWHGFEAILVGSSLCSWAPTYPRSPTLYIHLPFPIACPADFKLQH